MIFENKLKLLLQRGKLAVGAVVQLPCSPIVEILGYAGFDFVMIDTEHGLFDLETAANLVRAADGVGLTPLVRVVKNEPTLILKALDMGAKGVIIPHVNSKQDAQKAVKASKYGKEGRGSCPLVRANQYSLGKWSEYERWANENTMVIALIETLEAVDNIEEIVSVKGIDAVFLGAFDMSVGGGFKGQVSEPTIQKALDKILEACKKRNIPVMHTTTNGPDIDSWIQKGVRLIVQGAESGVFARACVDFLNSVKHLRNKKVD